MNLVISQLVVSELSCISGGFQSVFSEYYVRKKY